MQTIGEALDAIRAHLTPLDAERLALGDALGRLSSAAVLARRDEPAFDNSAMDGYAIRLADHEAGEPLPVRGESRAGGAWPHALQDGAAMRIFTGAPLPDGADTVVLQEDVDREGDHISIREAGPLGAHVRRRAEVLARGATVIDRGDAIGSGEIGLLASQGVGFVEVHRRPRVAILSTGDELRAIGEEAPPGTLYDSNAHALEAATREAGGIPTVLTPRGDALSALEEVIRRALDTHDVLVTTGGVSVGEYDLVPQALAAAGLREVVHKVRMKPGKPVRFSVGARALAFGLPGNPVSAWVGFELFVRPTLRVLLGDPRPYRSTLTVEVTHPVRGAASRVELARARLAPGEPPRASVHPARGSAAMTSLRGIDALLVLPEGGETRAAGARITALDLRTTRGAERHPFGA